MARVKGMKEKLHMPLYDAFVVPDGESFANAIGQNQRMIRYFMDVQGKTKLETNLQAAGVLPSQNSFEARAMRVVVSSPRNLQGAGEVNFMAELIYNSVTSLLVGEKVMIEMPTFWFPSGAGVSPNATAAVINHGEANPSATFRFAEPVLIEAQQNFRVEMLFPRDVPEAVNDVTGPLRTWVVLDGYLTRDVQ